MLKIFTLFLSLILGFSTLAQDKVLMFSGSGAGYTVNTGRNLTADTLFGRNTFYTFGTGLSYGKWKGNRLLYFGVNFGISSNKDNNNNGSTSYSLGPVVGLMKRVNLGGPLYYSPFGEAVVSYSNNRYKGPSGFEPAGRGWIGGVSASPLSFSLQATKALDLLLALGRVDAYYSSTRNPANSSQPEARYSVFNFYGSLNAISLRLLVRL